MMAATLQAAAHASAASAACAVDPSGARTRRLQDVMMCTCVKWGMTTGDMSSKLQLAAPDKAPRCCCCTERGHGGS
jgi:hypothetical protein